MEEIGNHETEETRKVDSEAGDGIANECVIEEKSEPVEETRDEDSSTLVAHVDDSEKPEESSNTAAETSPHVESIEPLVTMSEALVEVVEDSLQHIGAPDVTEAESKIEKIIPILDSNDGFSTVVTGFESKEAEPTSIEKKEVSPLVTESISKIFEDTVLPISNGTAEEASGTANLVPKENGANADVPVAYADNGGENSNMSNVPRRINQKYRIIVSAAGRQSWQIGSKFQNTLGIARYTDAYVVKMPLPVFGIRK
ncbi:hypothetical protein RJ639_028520 [Escallonia herrerae]|uniref:Uncharacterized protein n=1 Tax=Escallonia herrerae TaxID=1293975 RepID=A0AA88X4A4_9ASTE|nr:hypothetical protein RJ639_028520 [Escallonia herrerae]